MDATRSSFLYKALLGCPLQVAPVQIRFTTLAGRSFVRSFYSVLVTHAPLGLSVATRQKPVTTSDYGEEDEHFF